MGGVHSSIRQTSSNLHQSVCLVLNMFQASENFLLYIVFDDEPSVSSHLPV